MLLKMLLPKGKITQDLINILLSWRHSRFNVFCGPRIYPRDERAMENLACYIIRASFSQERMTYIQDEAKVVYQSKACPRLRSGSGIPFCRQYLPQCGPEFLGLIRLLNERHRGPADKSIHHLPLAVTTREYNPFVRGVSGDRHSHRHRPSGFGT